MLIAALVTVLGLLVGAVVATTRGDRLGGVVVVSLLAVYTLFHFVSLPIFVLSTLFSYLAIEQIQRRWLIYGHRLLVTAIVLGMMLPTTLILLFGGLRGGPAVVTEIDFFASVLPGIAAYNFYREDEDRRLRDALTSLGMLVVLIATGVVALVLWVTPPCVTCAYLPKPPSTYVPLLLLGNASDVAGVFGYETLPATPAVGTLPTVTAVIVFGLVLSDTIRTRLGLRPVGMITLPLVALFALRVWWALPLFLVAGAATTVAVFAIHHWTLLYGRALLSLASAIGIVLSLGLSVGFGLSDPVVTLFTGLFSGIGAYNLHVAAPRERPDVLVVNAGAFVATFGLARLLISPLPDGLARTVTTGYFVVGLVVLVASVWVWRSVTRAYPSRAAVRDAAFLWGESR